VLTAGLAAAAIAIAAVALGITGTFGAFTASITNAENHVVTGSDFSFSESLPSAPPGPQNPCATVRDGETAVCSTVNKFGADGSTTVTPMGPGDTRTTTVRISNNSGPSGFSGAVTLTADPCTQTPAINNPLPNGLAAGDLCGTMTVQVACVLTPPPTPPTPGSVTIGPETLTGLVNGGVQPILTIPAAGFVDCTFTTQLPVTAATNLQDIGASQRLIWTITQAA
jgi:hypothetical protein